GRLAIGNLRHTTVDDAGFGGADRMQHLSAGWTRTRDDVQPGVAPVRRHLPAAGCGIVLRADGGEEHLERGDAETEAQRAIAVIRKEPVITRLEGQRRGDADRLLA